MDGNGGAERGGGGRARRRQRPDDGGARAMLLRAVLLLCFCLLVRGQGRRVETMARVERQQQQQDKSKYEKYHCNGPPTGDYIVGLTREASVDRVVGSLQAYPRNLQKFDVLGNMFAATLSPQDVMQLLDYDVVEYVECDAKVSLGG